MQGTIILAVIVAVMIGLIVAGGSLVFRSYQDECAHSGRCTVGAPVHIHDGCFCLERPQP